MQSGTSLNPEYLQGNVRERAFELGNLLERGTSNSNRLLKHLNEIPAEKIFAKELNALPTDYYKENQKPLLAFGPIVETDPNGLVTEYPEHLFDAIDIPIMIGSNSREGLEPSLQYLYDPRFLVYLRKDFHFLIPIRTDLKFDPLKNQYLDAIDDIRNYYFKSGKITANSISEYITYIGDVLTSYPVDVMTRTYANKSRSSVFYYHFDYYSELNENKNDILKISTVTDGTWGAASGDELCYLFKCPRLFNNYIKLNQSETEEIIFLRKLVKLWSNFAKHGNPTPNDDNTFENFKWPNYNLENKEYLYISNKIEAKRIPYAKPPIGELRFKSPKPHEGWTDILEAKKERKACAQFYLPVRTFKRSGYFGDEDCFGELNMRKKNALKEAGTIDGTWGASIADELCYLFVCNPKTIYKTLLEDEDAEEIKVLKNMVKMWANFARTGNPTPDGDELTWNPATKENKECLVISDELKMHKNLHENVVRFWDDFISSYSEKALNGVVQDKRDEL
ncbi:unnamed protein product, partial [Iphiclides podalirius]